MARAQVGIIGGSGLYRMEGFQDVEEVTVDTPFGEPSGKYVVGTLEGTRVAFLPRHGVGHRILPGELNFRANILGFKRFGVEYILSASAVGSLQEDVHPLDVVIPDQFIDRTRGRSSTFFGSGLAVHVAFAHPFCAHLSERFFEAGKAVGASIHRGGTYVCIEGPQFSTLAESHLYRSWGARVIGMTNLQEAKLAREAEICYSTMALVTDYDCWHESEEDVTVEAVIENLNKNAETARRMIAETVRRLPFERDCECASALKYAIITQAEFIPEKAKRDLAPLIGKYLK
ncbi:MAG: S-methyl-5'-thioadenosine phosphorylase [Acidobacteriota bacterium]